MGWNSYGMYGLSTYIYVIYMRVLFYMINLLSSPYLLVFSDDRVCGTHEQLMLMQVVLVRLSHGAGITWESF